MVVMFEVEEQWLEEHGYTWEQILSWEEDCGCCIDIPIGLPEGHSFKLMNIWWWNHE